MDVFELADLAQDLLRRIEDRAVRVHCLTNSVAQPITANALLAIGAVPSLTADAEELSEFVDSADALLVNLGTPTQERRAAWVAAAVQASGSGKPWVLDPVMVDRAAGRLDAAQALLTFRPDAIRCNAGEAARLSLDGFTGILARTGAEDRISQNANSASLSAGHPYLAKVTAAGCALSAILAAFLAVGRDDPFAATVAGLASFGAAGAMAGKRAEGPGSFAVALLDSLSTLDAAAIRETVTAFTDDRKETAQ
ncbi:hydroxyethylthiazole kinase [Rhodospirillaceae bacterium KN72]|uniref:hydroxyethylthiazole kinase n=1 Tax=Pacificispira spongiicola TaxID=2729598 RepID=A0A7Y0DX65_9PROT|nr:hydroxyethylthiazole kinase [Pacificispira spongiicola]NMM43215.1 hydroxyethylthiazole kinase [Pacificispira spongiicola]